ncbi:MAG: pilin [Patescibacteria group bacterium UBA2163]
MRAFALASLLLLIPTALFAAAGDFEPLVTLPGVGYEGGEGSLSDYVNAVFNIIITFAAMLAVLRVIMGGFQYMTTEAVTAKGEARLTIQNAVLGLILLGGSWLILNTINPQILNLSALNFQSLASSQAEEDAAVETEAERRARADRLHDFVEGKGDIYERSLYSDSEFNEFEGTILEMTEISDREKQELRRVCRSSGKRYFTWQQRDCRITSESDGSVIDTIRNVRRGTCFGADGRNNLFDGRVVEWVSGTEREYAFCGTRAE